MTPPIPAPTVPAVAAEPRLMGTRPSRRTARPVVLFAIVCGGALFGFAGTVLAVPVTAVVANVAGEAGDQRRKKEAPDASRHNGRRGVGRTQATEG